uniref:Uncharacterized protein n=1 Tax=Arundo donax TaxID=35708 RepID=A0A0A8YSU4_ARUDO
MCNLVLCLDSHLHSPRGLSSGSNLLHQQQIQFLHIHLLGN